MSAYALLEGADDVRAYLREHDLLDGDPIEVTEVTAGNMNRVFVARSDRGSVAVKQAPPYVQIAGPSWPMSPERAVAEARVYEHLVEVVPELVPRVLRFDAERYVLVMEDLSDLRVVRDVLVDDVLGTRAVDPVISWEEIGRVVGTFVGGLSTATGRGTLGETAWADLVERAANPELCALTDAVLFDEPYRRHDHNVVPEHLRAIAEQVYDEQGAYAGVRPAVTRLHEAFQHSPQALLHGDLHTGSLMTGVRDGRQATVVFDPEFGFVGPIGFDLGLFWSNVVIAGHAADVVGRPDEAARRRTAIGASWDAYRTSLGDGAVHVDHDEVFAEAVGFAGIEAARRVIGYARAADIESLPDEQRARLQSLVLEDALSWLAHGRTDIQDLVEGRRG